MNKYIVALDQGTTSSRAVLFDENAQMLCIEQQEFTQHFPKPGWVEHDPREIWSSQLEVLLKLLKKHKISAKDVSAIGITNQRETAIVWDKSTGEPVHNAIVWQDKRTSSFCDELKKQGHEVYVKENTGLVLDAYFSGTKVNWILDNVPGAREKANKGNLLFGTVDSWLIWNLTNGENHSTDHTNASRTLLYNIRNLDWDKKMLELLDVPEGMLPEVKSSSAHFGFWEYDGHHIPIHGILGGSASGTFRASVLSSWHGQKHLWHRMFHANEHWR